MKGQELKVRDKKVQKMTRDGLTEKNLTQGTQQRISNRLEEVSFRQERQTDTTTGHQSKGCIQKQEKAQSPNLPHQQPEPFPIPQDAADRFSGAAAPEVWEPANAPASMRKAPDIPFFQMQPVSEAGNTDEDYRFFPEREKKKHRISASGQKSVQGTPNMAPEGQGSQSASYFPEPGQLQSGQEETGSEPGRPRSSYREGKEADPRYRTTVRKKQAKHFTVDAANPAQKITRTDERKTPAHQKSGRLRFEEEKRDEASARHQAKEKKKLVTKRSTKETGREDTSRLQYDRSELPPEDRRRAALVNTDMPDPETPPGISWQQKNREAMQHKVETTEKKLEKAQSKLPTRQRVRLQKQYDNGSGKVKYHLRFETEVIPEYERPSLPKQAGTALRRTTTTATVSKLHQKIRENEQDNVGVETAHKAEYTAEQSSGRFMRWNKRRLREKPYQEVRCAEKYLAKANANAAYQKLLADNPELQKKKAFAKWIQKQKLKRKYAMVAREAAIGGMHTTSVLTTSGQVVRAMVQKAVAHKAVLGTVAMAVLAVVLSGSLFSSCSAMLTGVQSAVISTCYVAEDTEIERSELWYTELETDLQRNIDRTETDNPGYDEYRYNIGDIGHNPYELMGYLSAIYGNFTYAEAEAAINQLFSQQYQLTRTEIVETRTYTDSDGEEQEYDWYVLQTTLTVRPLSGIIASGLAPGDQTDRYCVYMQTCGNRQCYGNPFDFAWVSYVTSPYGYRTHPITGAKDLHRGVDIRVPAVTPVRAMQDGRVISAGNAGSYGLCVVIEGTDGHQSRYAHCSSLSVRAGQEVKRGDIIAAVGGTGSSTETYLHLEVTHNGQYLNPYYYVDNGGDGYLPGGGAAGIPDFPADPGAAMGDGSFGAMLAEAEKYLGFPYVWGGSSPSTSFDCSGYVSWVINHSGVGSVGRQTAQGLYNLCTPVSRNDMQPGDLVFFTGTYSTANPVTHVGIYVGGNRMIHCGNPISYTRLDTNYWISKFYSGGRLP